MNVLHLNRFFYSGQTTHVFSLVREQQKQGVSAALVMDGYPSHEALNLYKETIEELGAVVIRPGDTAALLRSLQGRRIHLLHVHSPLSYPLAYGLAEKMGIPCVITCHGLGLNKQEYRPFFQKASCVICISPRVADSLREYAHKLYIIPNGVDLTEFRPGDKNGVVKIVFAARMDHAKQRGYEQFCKAVDLLNEVEFYVAANKKPCSKTAEYLGWVSEMGTLLAQTDIVAGTGRAILEGLAAGNAAVVLGKTYQGVLTPENAARQRFLDVSGLTGSEPCYRDIFYDLNRLLENRGYLKQLQQFGRELVTRDFDNRVHTRRIIDLYKKIIV